MCTALRLDSDFRMPTSNITVDCNEPYKEYLNLDEGGAGSVKPEPRSPGFSHAPEQINDIKLSNTSQQADTAVRDTMNPGVRLSASYDIEELLYTGREDRSDGPQAMYIPPTPQVKQEDFSFSNRLDPLPLVGDFTCGENHPGKKFKSSHHSPKYSWQLESRACSSLKKREQAETEAAQGETKGSIEEERKSNEVKKPFRYKMPRVSHGDVTMSMFNNNSRDTHRFHGWQQHFGRTRKALHQSGLLGLTMRTAGLMQENQTVDREVQMLKQNLIRFQSLLLNNVENQKLRDCLVERKAEEGGSYDD